MMERGIYGSHITGHHALYRDDLPKENSDMEFP
jgi:hypothetical protein